MSVPQVRWILSNAEVVEKLLSFQVLQRYADILTDFEQSEILHYPQIYFVGKTTHKVRGTPHSSRLRFDNGILVLIIMPRSCCSVSESWLR